MSVLQEVRKEAQKYTLHNYGNLLSVDDPIFDESERLWKVKLKTDYPRLIKNDAPKERLVRTLLIEDLGAIWVDEKLRVLKNRSTPRSECLDTLRTRLSTWEERAERIIVQTSAKELANTGIARVFLNPVSMILANFLEEETTIIPVEEVERLRKTARIFQWMCLLEDLEFVRKVPEGYTYGNMFTEVRRQIDDEQSFLTLVFAHIIRERYSLLRDVFHVKQFESLVHMDSCYYRPALEARRILFQTSESLFKRYMVQYRNRHRLYLPGILLELCNSQALKRKDKYYSANERLFEKMLEKSEKTITLSSPKI
jgi:hypothetical protein